MININLMVKEVLDLYFNPRCSKCRIAKVFLEKNGVSFRIIEYLNSKISREEIKDILRKGNLKAFDIIRKNEEEFAYSFKEIYYVLLKHFKLIVGITVFTISCTVYYTLVIKPEYVSTSTIMISEDPNSASFLDLGLGKERNYIEND